MPIRFNPNPKKKKRYDLDEDEIKPIEKKQEIQTIRNKIDNLLNFQKLDESNPLERAKKFNTVRNNPPKPGVMQVEMRKDIEGDVYSISKQDGKKIVFKEGPFFKIDPNMLFRANIAASPINSVSNLLELKGLKEKEGKKILHRVDDRQKEFPWGWVIIGLSLIPGIILFVFWLF